MHFVVSNHSEFYLSLKKDTIKVNYNFTLIKVEKCVLLENNNGFFYIKTSEFYKGKL